jgi:hypothetical protein
VIWFLGSHVLSAKPPMGRAVRRTFHVGLACLYGLTSYSSRRS